MTTVLKAFPKPKTTDLKKLERELLKAIDKTTKFGQKQFGKTVRTWDRKPDFPQTGAARDGDDLVGAVGTDNLIYLFVTRGTKPHVIRGKNGGLLTYSSKYRAKTRRRILSSYRGGGYGGYRRSREVNHPGTEGREFEEAVADVMQRELEGNVNSVLMRVVEQ